MATEAECWPMGDRILLLSATRGSQCGLERGTSLSGGLIGSSFSGMD